MLFLGMGWRIGSNWIERKTWTEGCFFFIRFAFSKTSRNLQENEVFYFVFQGQLGPQGERGNMGVPGKIVSVISK